jgi:hypothetical protein
MIGSSPILPSPLLKGARGGAGEGAKKYDGVKAWSCVNPLILSDQDSGFSLLLHEGFKYRND